MALPERDAYRGLSNAKKYIHTATYRNIGGSWRSRGDQDRVLVSGNVVQDSFQLDSGSCGFHGHYVPDPKDARLIVSSM